MACQILCGRITGRIYENLPDIDHNAHASVRVMAQCMAMGQAAGVTGALASSQEITPRRVPVAELQDKLRKLGAVI